MLKPHSRIVTYREFMQRCQIVDQLPPYVFQRVAKTKQIAEARGQSILDFAMGNPDLPTPQHVIDRHQQALLEPNFQRYQDPRGGAELRQAICDWYADRFQVNLNPETQAVCCSGSKTALGYLALALADREKPVIVPTPFYPIHTYGFIIAEGQVQSLPFNSSADFLEQLKQTLTMQTIAGLMISFPTNPTADCVDLAFLTEVVALAKSHDFWIIHDFAYAELYFTDKPLPSILQVPGASDVAVETYSLSKSYHMPGWRVGFVCGNETLIAKLTKVETYFDYGMFNPIEQAAVAALKSETSVLDEVRANYRERRDWLCDGLNATGWSVKKTQATMFVWVPIPEPFKQLGSIEFCNRLILEAGVALSPGVGFGDSSDDHVRFSLIHNAQQTDKAINLLANWVHNSK